MPSESGFPAPLVSEDVDLRDFRFMPLDVVRLRDSDVAALPDGDAFRAAVMSWCVSWHQQPAASLPDDDGILARLLGYGRDVAGWKAARGGGALHGWIKCSDGRLYHPVVAEKAIEAWILKRKQRARTAAATAARMSHGMPLSTVTENVTNDVTNDVTESKGQDRTRQDKEITPPKGVPPLCEEAVSLFNDLAGRIGLARVQRLTASRRRSLIARLGECGGVEGWKVALGKVRDSPFLRGEETGWRAGFDFLVRAEAFTKLMEGGYDGSKRGKDGPARGLVVVILDIGQELRERRMAGDGDGAACGPDGGAGPPEGELRADAVDGPGGSGTGDTGGPDQAPEREHGRHAGGGGGVPGRHAGLPGNA